MFGTNLTWQPLAGLALGLCWSAVAYAGQSVTGANYIQVDYSDHGTWNWTSTASGFSARQTTSDSFLDWSYPGNPWQIVRVNSSDGDYLGNYNSSDYTVVSQSNSVSGTTYEATVTFTAGNLSVIKTETWDANGRAIGLSFVVENTGTTTITDIIVEHAVDPDPDNGTGASPSTASTYNDVLD